MQTQRLPNTEEHQHNGHRRTYKKPHMTTYTDEELLAILGPARTSYSPTPQFITGG